MKYEHSSELEFDATLIDCLVAHIAIIDDEGTILRTNSAWDAFGDDSTQIKRTQKGNSYLATLQSVVEFGNDYGLKLLLGLKKVLNGTQESFSLTYPAQTQFDTFWFKQTIRPANNEQQFIIINEDITASVKAKYQHQINQNRYHIQFEQSLDGILIVDKEGNIIDANPAACDILGRSRVELVACTRQDIVDITDSRYQDALEDREDTGTYQLETQFIHKDGSKIPVEVTSQAYRIPSGKLQAIVNFRDISRRKKAEQELFEKQSFIESVLASIPGAFFVINDKGKLVRWNQNVITRLGYPEDELTQKNVLDFVVEEVRNEVLGEINKCLSGQELVMETKVKSHDDEILDYYINAKRFIQNGKKYIVGSALDITQEKSIRRKNQQTQRMLQQLFDNAPVGIAIVDGDNKIQSVNKNFEEIFKYSQEEAESKFVDDLIVPKYKLDESENIANATFNGQTLRTKSVRITKDNKEVPVLIGSVPVSYNDEIIAIYGLYVDISHQQEYQDKLEDALKEKETLLAELHHRVKNNLALISSLLELQVFDSDNEAFNKQLTDIKSRILTIASIHEVLYKNGKMHSIPFRNFIDEFITEQNASLGDHSSGINIENNVGNIRMTIDQSIPCGLLVNELLSLILEQQPKSKQVTDINITLRQYGQQIHLILDGHDIVEDPQQLRESDSMHNVLIEPLVQQLNGSIIWPTPGNSYQKFELIFTKEKGNGPARHWSNKQLS